MKANFPAKRPRLQQIDAGIHLVVVTDLSLLKNSDKTPVDHNGTNYMVVKFCDKDNKIHEQHYPINCEKQKFFDRFLKDIGIDNSKPVSKKEVLNRRLWIAIKDVYILDDDTVLTLPNGDKLVERFVFRTYQHVEGGNRPAIVGDPLHNGGVASDMFVDYRRVIQDFDNEPMAEAPPISKSIVDPMSDKEPAF